MDCNIILPSGPSVTVHRGWRVPRTRGNNHHRRDASGQGQVGVFSARQSPPSSPVPQSLVPAPEERRFEFINSGEPGGRTDPQVTSRARAHIRNENARKRRSIPRRAAPLQTLVSDEILVVAEATTGFLAPINNPLQLDVPQNYDAPEIPPNIGQPTALHNYIFPIEMRARTHALLSQYLTYIPRRIYPLELCLESNPMRSPEWFQYAVQDAATLHSMLYVGAMYMALYEGKTETRDTAFHLSGAASIVNRRLEASRDSVADCTIGAVSCLALGEAIIGNENAWRLHMLGIKQMMQLRQNVNPPSLLLRAKLQRSDVTGAIDFGAAPLLPFLHSPSKPIWDILPPTILASISMTMNVLLMRSALHPALIASMIKLTNFSYTITYSMMTENRLNPSHFTEDLYHLEHEFLSFPTTLPPDSVDAAIDKACRTCALLYLKAILQEFPHSSVGSSVLLDQLKCALNNIPPLQLNSSLVLWLALVGASSSTGERRLWFVKYLTVLKGVMSLATFGDGDPESSGFLELHSIFGHSFISLWDEILLEQIFSWT
ncbi:hypothetical protein BGZ60DRAFT_522614 [Tricladium varicosporioides]|nr:hypothetical protein BGZ60DRAFT_522614 [Hymenoscyphus varicosporioides]